jgi:hypothetical protein
MPNHQPATRYRSSSKTVLTIDNKMFHGCSTWRAVYTPGALGLLREEGKAGTAQVALTNVTRDPFPLATVYASQEDAGSCAKAAELNNAAAAAPKQDRISNGQSKISRLAIVSHQLSE